MFSWLEKLFPKQGTETTQELAEKSMEQILFSAAEAADNMMVLPNGSKDWVDPDKIHALQVEGNAVIVKTHEHEFVIPCADDLEAQTLRKCLGKVRYRLMHPRRSWSCY